ncbi:WecB/TagA/CpsF family glycosyltransferase [Butyrivibrio sp. CB08]|uniref:WecB/TagA/CpsF family glycosyltransferase n=1 Tax=Butyrivibrio sp. CB08 TaxID=2364879 RepID=UPI001FAAC37A|nr:WecB/TagA/CpsF family glycosyltransferase [Butyrivibrio sp. CB08]
MAKENTEYCNILNAAALTYPDGAPVAKLQRKRKHPEAKRVAGPDFMDLMFKATADGTVKHYFYGSKLETLEALKRNLIKKYPNLNICGMYSPPFRPLSPEEDDEAISRINDSDADIIWIGLGAPKQEQWMNAHKGKFNGVMMGVGAGFDFHAGTIQRAPVWVQKIGLEWLYRLTRDPKRLFMRYLVTNTKFFWYLLTEHSKRATI